MSAAGKCRWLTAGGVAAVVIAGYLWTCRGGGGGTETAEATGPAAVPRKVRVYENGQWVTRDPDELLRALDKVRLRPVGLVLVSGRVVDHASGAGIPGAEVALAGPLGESTATTDDDGAYEMYVAPGPYRPFARADGYVTVGERPIQRVPGAPDPSALGAPLTALAPLLDVRYDHYGVDIRLAGAAVIEGTVYDADGRPVEGALVVASQGARYGTDGLVTVLGTHMDETDYDGSYQLTVPAGYPVVEAHHEAYAGAQGYPGRALSAGDRARVDLTLADGCIITGRVVTARGRPIGPGALERQIGGEPPNDYAPIAQIREDGTFRVALREETDVTLRAWPWKSMPSRPEVFRCTDGAYFEGVELRTQAGDPELEGSIVTARGEPVPGAFIDVYPIDHGGMAQQERADAYGEWAVYQLDPGLYRVMAYVPGEGVASAAIEVPARWLPLRLSGTGSIAGTVEGVDSGSITLRIDSCTVDLGEGVTSMLDDVAMPDLEIVAPVERGQYQVDGLPACAIGGTAFTATGQAMFYAQVTAGGIANVPLKL